MISNKDALIIALSRTGESHRLLFSLTGEWAFAAKHFSFNPNKGLSNLMAQQFEKQLWMDASSFLKQQWKTASGNDPTSYITIYMFRK